MASNSNNTHHSASNQMFSGYPMYLAGLQYTNSSSTTRFQISSRLPAPGLVEGQSQSIDTDETAITPAFLVEQDPVPGDIHHATYTGVYQVGLGGATSPVGLRQTFPISYSSFSDDYYDLSAARPLEETQSLQIDLAEPQNYQPAEPIIVSDNQDYATYVVETQPNHVRDPSGSSNTHDGLHRYLLDRRPSGIWRCSDEGCLRVFERKGSLKRHRRTAHLGTELLDCPVDGCPRVGNKGFTRSDNLRQHRRSKHGQDIPWVKVRRHGAGAVRTIR